MTDYSASLAAAGRPATTIKTRAAHLERLAREIGVAPVDVDGPLLLSWFAGQVHWKRETRRGYRNSAAGFFKWAYRAGHIADDPAADLPVVKADHPAPRPAPDRVWAEALMRAEPRVALMLRLAAEAGLRRAEVSKVHTRDLTDGIDGPLLVVHGKGNRERIVPITDELAERIAAGAPGHSPEMAAFGVEGWLFPGDDNGHLSPRWVGRLCAEAMPEGWTMHSLRHRFATRAYRGTRNLRAVQTLLGHASVAVTERYTAVDDGEVRAAMMSAASRTAKWTAVAATAAAVILGGAGALRVIGSAEVPGGAVECYFGDLYSEAGEAFVLGHGADAVIGECA